MPEPVVLPLQRLGLMARGAPQPLTRRAASHVGVKGAHPSMDARLCVCVHHLLHYGPAPHM
jgi:hypothetical protein